MSTAIAGKAAVITGAARGLGAAFARGFASAGAKVALVDRDEATLADTTGTIADSLAIACDLTDTAQLRSVPERTIERFGQLDILVNCAGVFHAKATADVQAGDWDTTFAINLRAPFFLSQACIPALVANQGCIINISSVAGFYPRADQAAYCASKAALEHLTRVLALDLAPRGVRVNALRPGIVDTGIALASFGPETQTRWGRAVPLGKIAQPADLVEAALFIAGATHMTGQVVCIDGGQTINFVRG